jgi:hypothetical protein
MGYNPKGKEFINRLIIIVLLETEENLSFDILKPNLTIYFNNIGYFSIAIH